VSGWKTMPLGELVESVKSWNPLRANPDNVFDYIDLSAVDQATKAIIGAREITCGNAPSRARQLVATGDILVSTVRPNLNGTARVNAEFDGATASTGFCVLRPRSNFLDSSYLFHWVKSPQFVADMVSKATGASYPAVSDRIILESTIAVPSLPEQRRIASILDQADALRAKRREALAQLDSLTQSIFMEMFGDTVINPKRFPMMSISEITDKGRGLQLQPDTSVWNLNLDQIESNTGRIHEKVICRLEQLGSSTFPFKAGTVLYSKLRPYLNKVVIADEDGYATTELVPIRCKQDIVKPIFLATFLRSKRFLDFANLTVAGAKMPRMVMDSFWSYTLPLPDLALQNEFERKFKAVEKLISIQRSSIVKLDTLFSSLQHRAFQGEL
jgi:type I restriction enzyme S subunit